MPIIVILCPFHHVVEKIEVPPEYDARTIHLSGFRSFAGHIPCGTMNDRRTVYVEVTFDQEGAVYVRWVLRTMRMSDEGGLKEKPARW